jgi:transcriptional regulator with XRE-family HTH domain
MSPNFYGTRIRASRERLKLTVKQFADCLNVSLNTQKNYESGRTVPDLDYLDGCAQLGIDPLQLLHAGAKARKTT